MNDPAVTIEYRCTEGEGCQRPKPSKDCPACNTVRVTRRILPKCQSYIDGPAKWIEVYMQTTPEGQRFFFGTSIWEPKSQSDQSEFPAELVEHLTLTEQVPPFTEIHGCDDQGRVRFYVEKLKGKGNGASASDEGRKG